MKIFAVKDETMPREMILGYLIYYENAKAFYMELADGIDPWNAPPVLSSFAERGEYSINSYWSLRWVQERIVPRDRQNISQILREHNLKEYDEFSLLQLVKGRCEQDDFYLEEIPADPLPELLSRRWQTKITDVNPLESPKLLVFFRSGAAKVVDIRTMNLPACEPFLTSQERFNAVEVQPDGYGVYWNDRAMIAHRDLYARGISVPLTLQDLYRYVQTRVVSAAEACSILDCSRQNIDDLMRRNKLHPIRTDAKYKLFSRAEVIQRRK